MDRRHFLANSAAFGFVNLFSGMTMVAASQNIYVPPEESRHIGTLMQWPVNKLVHPEAEFLDILQKTIADIANTISEFEPVTMLAAEPVQHQAKRLLSSKVSFIDIPTDDLWCRDSGPLFAKQNDKLVVSHIQFNGWGGKQSHKHDGGIAALVANHLGLPLLDSGLVGEAGGVDHDGHGLLMAHESSWLNKNRNPGLTRNEIEKRLLTAYGADKIIWSSGVYGEDITDYHIDSLARFTGPASVLINLPETPDMKDPFHLAAIETHDKLIAAKLEVEVIPEPLKPRVKKFDFVASYANYYVCNKGVIAPQFGDRLRDRIAKQALKKHYPGREVVTLNVDALGEIGGGIHCATQQIPA